MLNTSAEYNVALSRIIAMPFKEALYLASYAKQTLLRLAAQQVIEMYEEGALQKRPEDLTYYDDTES
jgi:hypothetical protein